MGMQRVGLPDFITKSMAKKVYLREKAKCLEVKEVMNLEGEI